MSTIILNESDNEFLKQKGIAVSQVNEQIESFVKGFPFLSIIRSAGPDNGLVQVTNEELSEYLNKWDVYLEKKKTILKFVPASGAASRMFKDLFEFLDG